MDAASGEITGAVVGSTLTTVLVFVPLAFIVGVYGQFFAALSWSLSIAVLVSMVISLTLVPVFAAKFLAGRPMPAPGPIYRFFARRLRAGCSAVALRFPWLTLAAVAGGGRRRRRCCSPAFPTRVRRREPGKPPPAPLVKGLETGLMPAMDEGAFILDYWAPSGTPLDRDREDGPRHREDPVEEPGRRAYVRRTGAENWACSPPRPAAATSRSSCGRPRTTRSVCSPSRSGRRWKSWRRS